MSSFFAIADENDPYETIMYWILQYSYFIKSNLLHLGIFNVIDYRQHYHKSFSEI